jgi:hypothetical protein
LLFVSRAKPRLPKSKRTRRQQEGCWEVANNERERALELGYTPNDRACAALRDEINNLRKQLEGMKPVVLVSSKSQEKLASLTQHRAEKQKRFDGRPHPQKAA